jgi:rhodanese-related sulfurtransferase
MNFEGESFIMRLPLYRVRLVGPGPAKYGDFMKRRYFCVARFSVMFLTALAVALVSTAGAAVQQMTPEELKKLIDTKDPHFLVVDNQPPAAHALGHIKGAINFPWARDIRSPGNLPRDKMLILYCDCAAPEALDLTNPLGSKSDSCPAEDDASDVADQLMRKFGYTNIRVLEGGWSRWQQLGYPVEGR